MGGEDGCEGSVECVREILQLSGKSQGLSKSSGCGNHDCTLRSLFSSIVSVLNRTAKRLCVTNVTGLLLAFYVVILT